MKKHIMLIIAMSLLIVGCRNSVKEVETKVVEETKDSYSLLWGVKNKLMYSFVSEDEKSYCTVQEGINEDLDKNPILSYMLTIPMKYAVEVNMIMDSRREKNTSTGIVHLERSMQSFDINVYGLKSKQLENSINLLKILQEKNMNIMPTDYTMFATRMYENRPCLVFAAEDIVPSNKDKNNNTKRMIYVDVETGEIFEKEYEDISSNLEDENRINLIFTSQHGKFLKQNMDKEEYLNFDSNSVRTLSFWEGCRQIHFANIENISENNEKLFVMFPELRKTYNEIKESRENIIVSVDIVLTGSPSEEEIMELILPEGRVLSFEGIKISDKNSIDGQERDIHSFDEWREYCKPAENPGKYASPIIEVAD